MAVRKRRALMNLVEADLSVCFLSHRVHNAVLRHDCVQLLRRRLPSRVHHRLNLRIVDVVVVGYDWVC